MKQCCLICTNSIDHGDDHPLGRLIYCTAKQRFRSGRHATHPNHCTKFESDASATLEAMAEDPAEDTITDNQISLF